MIWFVAPQNGYSVNENGVPANSQQSSQTLGSDLGGSDCGRLEVFDVAVLATSGDYEMFDEDCRFCFFWGTYFGQVIRCSVPNNAH